MIVILAVQYEVHTGSKHDCMDYLLLLRYEFSTDRYELPVEISMNSPLKFEKICSYLNIR